MTQDIAAVVIGRNEGTRLRASLQSLIGEAAPIVYVDSGSADGSIARARELGIEAIALDPARPFTAARARNAGFAALQARGATPFAVQFIDGDCLIEPGWIARGRAALLADPELGIVTGWRQEEFPDSSIYNAMLEVEWHRPAGPIRTCGGDMIVRNSVFRTIGGFNESLIVTEDEDFCLRVAKAGHGIERLAAKMTTHNARMTRFSQWWRRSLRGGYGFARMGILHPPHRQRERQRAWVFALFLPLVLLAGISLRFWPLIALAPAAYALSCWRSFRGLRREGLPMMNAAQQAVFLTLSKLPNLLGMLNCYAHALRRTPGRIIEYNRHSG